MSSLSDLSNEIIIKIFQRVGDDDRPANSYAKDKALVLVALVCHRFGALARPIIFEDCHVNVSIGTTFPTKFSKEFDHLIRSLSENPSLAILIQSVNLYWISNSPALFLKVNGFLTKLVSLRKLVIGVAIGQFARTDAAVTFDSAYLGFNDMEMLEDVRLSHEAVPSGAMVRYLFLPPFENCTKRSFLVSLTIGSLSFEDMRRLLQCNVCLKILDWTSPGLPKSAYDQEANHSASLELEIMSPREIGETLSPVLGRLEILRLGQVVWCSHDGSRFDLSAARYLKQLCLPAYLMFSPWGASYVSRRGVYRLLPATIELVQIHIKDHNDFYARDSVINAYKKLTVRGIDILLLEKKRMDQLSWLDEILTFKQDYTPKLKIVLLEEQGGEYENERHVVQLPSSIANVARDSGVELSLVYLSEWSLVLAPMT